MLSPLRVVIEHTNSGIKRLRIIKDTLRVPSGWFRDTVMVVTCGLPVIIGPTSRLSATINKI
ncbi:hypothetical protein ACO2Q8_06875 [Larkinella sp. VNQ87]